MTRYLAPLLLLGLAVPLLAQDPGATVPRDDAKRGGSANIRLLAHVENNAGAWKAADIEMEQDAGRPYVYVSGFVNNNFQVYDVRNEQAPKLLLNWTIENPELHQGIGAMDGKYFKLGDRYFYVQSFQFAQGGPDSDLGAIVFDVTGLPDPAAVREVARIRYAPSPGGFHNIFAYKHSSGRVLLFTTIGGDRALVYDLGRVVAGGDPASWLVGEVPNPTPMAQLGASGYHDFYVGYDVARRRDVFYGAGLGGYSAWDVSAPEAPSQLFTITSLGMDLAHTFTPSPDGNIAVTETEYQYTPLRIWDLTEGQDGRRQNLDIPLSAWTADWRDLSHNHEVRWPFVFVSAYEDGFFVFNLTDPKHPRTEGWYYTCQCTHEHGFGGGPNVGWESTTSVMQGGFGVDVRNRDGLIVLSDMRTGLWLFRMDGFSGWPGASVGMPNISSVQDYDRGPAPSSR